MLFYSPQIWASDNTDVLDRMKIQYGLSLLYPVRCIGSHVTAVPNHLTGATARARTRGLVAMCGTFGCVYVIKFTGNIFYMYVLVYRCTTVIMYTCTAVCMCASVCMF